MRFETVSAIHHAGYVPAWTGGIIDRHRGFGFWSHPVLVGGEITAGHRVTVRRFLFSQDGPSEAAVARIEALPGLVAQPAFILPDTHLDRLRKTKWLSCAVYHPDDLETALASLKRQIDAILDTPNEA